MLVLLPLSLQSVSDNSRSLVDKGYSGTRPSAESDVGRVGAMCP